MIDAKPRITQTHSRCIFHCMSAQVCLHFSTLVSCLISTCFLLRAPIFLHRSTMLRFIFTLHSRVMCLSLISTLSLCRDSLKFCTLTHEIISQRQIHMMFTSCFLLPHWQQISASTKSRGALLCLDRLLQVLCLDGLTLEPILQFTVTSVANINNNDNIMI